MTAISPPVQSVLELFKGPLSNVRFADVDAAGLANMAAEVEAAADEVQRQEQALAELRQGLAQRQDALLALAQQALAYARVYAENDEALLEELNRISLPRAAKPRKTGAAKASGTREAAAPELASPVPADEAPAPDEDGVHPVEAAPVEAAAPAPLRNGRKARGTMAQRAPS